MSNPKVSIVVPFHWMKSWQFFLTRCLESIELQTFKDYEVILTKAGSMPVNTNRAIECARGELIKILYMDDRFTYKDSLDIMVNGMVGEWLIAGTEDNRNPRWTDDIETGNNKLGSPSALMIRNGRGLLFDERLSWLLDCDLYKRLHNKYGPPTLLNGNLVILGKHDGQMTHILTDEQKLAEHELMKKKYA